jgi:hypothetical protein
MRRFYVTKKTVLLEPIGKSKMPMHNLFHPAIGSHFIDLSDGYILMSTDFATEWAEETWHTHPEVAHLPHPTKEPALATLPEMPDKQFTAAHLQALASIGITGDHNVWDVHRIASARNRSVKLSSTY